MSYHNQANKTISSIIDYYNTSADAADDDALRKSYSMPLPMQDFPSASPIISKNDKASPSQQHQHSSSSIILRTSKSEDNTATTATHLVQPQHKLDRYGFIVNMDVHGNIISSQRENSTAPKNHSSQHNDQVLHPANNTNTGTKSSSTYSMDTNYDRPNAATSNASKRTPQPPITTRISNADDGIDAVTKEASQFNQQQKPPTTLGNRARKYYMQRRTKPLSISEAARAGRRIVKWDTMLRYNIPSEVVTLQEQQQGREQQQLQRYTLPIKVVLPALSQKQRRCNTMKRRLRKGVPNQRQRSVIWPILCNVAAKMSASPGLYHRLLFEITQHDLTVPTQETITTATTALTTGPTKATTPSLSSNGATNATTARYTTGTASGEVEDYTKIEINYSRTIKATDDDSRSVQPPPPPAIQFQYTKSFHSIQETIERDLHRTFPRHCMFYSTEVDDDEDECYTETNHSLDENFATNPTDPASDVDHGGNEHPKLILGDVDTDDQHSSDTREIQQKSICGTNEISNLIRELDLVPQVATHLMNQASQPAPPIATVTTAMDHHHDDTATSHPTTPISETDPAKNHCSDLKTMLNGSIKDNSPPSHNYKSADVGTISSNQISPSNARNNIHTTTTNNNNNTYTNENLLDGEGGQSRLRRVLKAYSLYDREIGYCQGMNFIAAMFLTIVTEEYAFWMLVGTYPSC